MDGSSPVAAPVGGQSGGTNTAKKTVLLRRKLDPAQAIPSGALTAEAVRDLQEASTQANLAARAAAAKRDEEEKQAKQQQQERITEQQQMLNAQSQPVPAPTKKALLMRKIPVSPTVGAPASGAAAAVSAGSALGLGSLLPHSLALAAARGTGPGSPGWSGPPRDPRTGAVTPWEVVGSPAQFERAEKERIRQNREAHGMVDEEEEQRLQQQQQQQEYEEHQREQQQRAATTTANGTPARSSRLAQQLTAELAMARRFEAEEAAAAAGGGKASNGQQFAAQMLAGQESRILAAHARTQASWGAFKSRVAAQIGVPESQLNISRSDDFRAKVEEADLLDKARPADDKGAGREEQWAGSLRGIGHTYIPIGNMVRHENTQRHSNARIQIENDAVEMVF